MTFAKNTTVNVEKTRGEIERLLKANGATTIIVQTSSDVARVGFEAHSRRLLFTLTLPKRDDRKFTHVSQWTKRGVVAADKMHDQECRRLWRALLLVIKAKLESVASGIETFDQAFLAAIVVPGQNGATTVGEHIMPALAGAYERGLRMPPLLGAG